MDLIAEIRALAEEYAMCGGSEHRDCTIADLFYPPATIEQVCKFEQEMHIKLPNDLVRYLTELGNGGIGPDYGIWSLDEMRENNPYAPIIADLPPMIGGGLPEEEWKKFAQEAASAEYEEPYEQRLVAGGIFISTPGCTMDTLLMCKGAAAGEVVVIDFDYLSYDDFYDKPIESGFPFADWMIEGLHAKIARRKNGINIESVTRYNENGHGMAGEKLTDLLIELRIAQLIEEGDVNAATLAPEIRAFYERAFGNGTFRMWIAMSGRNVIGTVGLTLTEKPPYSANPTGKIGVLSSMYVAPEFRRRGIAKCLLGYVMRWEKRNGIGTIHITASEQGMKLYESCGFTHNERFMKYDLKKSTSCKTYI